MHKRPLIISTTIITALLLVVGWRLTTHNGYETTTPIRGKAVQAVYATGVVEPVNWSAISAHTTGRIISIKKDEGAQVMQGQVLAAMDDSVEQAKVTELTARLTYLREELDRKRTLNRKDIGSLRDYQQTQSDYNATQAQLLAQNELIDRMQISSPIDGIVLKRIIEPGETAMQGAPVFWVGQALPMRITAEVDEEDIPLVTLGQQVLIKADAFPQEMFKGSVTEITPKGDPVNKSFRIRISLPDDTKLLIGMTVEVNIVAKEVANALLIPASSVINDAVWTIHGSQIKKHKIVTGIRDEEQVEVLEGLGDKDTILLNPSLYLATKQKKKP